jgi:putative N-acetylmannosamine-6-phosphate epimerase/predicted NBD/HSP70 family sugar kinase
LFFLRQLLQGGRSVHSILDKLKGGLIGSCQAYPNDPLEDTDTIRRISQAVVAAGVSGLRLNSAEHIAAIRQDTDLPIIGIEKCYKDGKLRITPDFAAAKRLAEAGTSIIALDCTARAWTFGDPWRELVGRIHSELHLPVMADTATLDEALAASEAGADMVGTTLNGYTDDTEGNNWFDWDLLRELASRTSTPIVAEGHIGTPAEARRAIAAGAWCVVVGSAITRPGVIATGFVKALKPARGTAAIGVDIGGTAIKAGVVSSLGAVSLTTQVPTEATRGRETIAAAIESRSGSVFAATDNLPGWAGFGLAAFVQKKFSLHTRAVNDAQAAALAELYFGRGRALDSFAAITLGTGLGGGYVCHGKLVEGGCGFAGTFGHQTIHSGGRACNCGRHGCLEAYVSMAALLNEYEQQAGKNALQGLQTAAAARRVSELAKTGDDDALAAYSALADALAEGIANVFNMLDPQAVFLSGGLVEGHGAFVDAVRDHVGKLLHFGAKRRPRIEISTLGYLAGVQGAAARFFEG